MTDLESLAEGARDLNKGAHMLRKILHQEFPDKKHLMRYIDKITDESRKLFACLNIQAELKVGDPAVFETGWSTSVSSVDHLGRPTSVQTKLEVV